MKSWLFYAVLSAIFAALTATFAKAGLKSVDSDLATAIRTSFVLFIVWSIVILNGTVRGVPQISKSAWIFLILSAIATGLSWLFYYRALQMGKLSEVSAIDKSSLLFTVLLAIFIFREPLSAKLLTGIILIMAGLIVLSLK
jgi:bacterial/archaeal transporter family protein